MKDRIFALVQAYDMTAGQFAEEIGVQKSGMSHIFSGRNNPSLDFVQRVLDRFPEVNINWLILGNGSMFNSINTQVNENVRVSEPQHVATENKILQEDLFGNIEDTQRETVIKQQSRKSEQNVSPQREVSKPQMQRSDIQSIRGETKKIVFFYEDGTFEEFVQS